MRWPAWLSVAAMMVLVPWQAFAVPSAGRYASVEGVHARLSCASCHLGVTAKTTEGAIRQIRSATLPKSQTCAQCHTRLLQEAQRDGTAASRPRLHDVVRNIQAYEKSFHARPSPKDPSTPLASCDNCHDTHTFDIPLDKRSSTYQQWRLKNPRLCGESCHEEALEQYADSIHGQAVFQKQDVQSAVCMDCHSAHDIGNTSASPVKLAITAQCGGCHAEQYRSYKATYHGKITTLGYANTAKCYDCHGGHEVLAIRHPDAKVHPNNRLETCRSCHGKKGVGEASPGFLSFQPHVEVNNFDKSPQVWTAYRLMVGLLIGTFVFFWLHTVLWFYREFRERQTMRRHPQPHIQLSPSPLPYAGKHFKRFDRTWRIAHLVFAISLMILTLTGMPMFYPESAWAPWVMHALGGPSVAGVIHRVAAVMFSGVFFWHVVYVAIRLWRQRATFRWFGPDSLLPNRNDLRDMAAMFRWFLGRGPRPAFDRWSYWEKFDYWAPFWGVTIIGVSGLMMWGYTATSTWLPGWVLNVAAIFHGEEAFLAVVFLFTVHFFNNHFRPDKFPVEIVMFTGTMPLERYRNEHRLQYERLLASGELEKHLVEPPAIGVVKRSRILGFVLIVLGLILLSGVAMGFFGL